jgi:hypothetical protein
MMRRIGKACLGALLGALLVFAVFFVLAFFVNTAGIPAILGWLLMMAGAVGGFVVVLAWPARVVDRCRICGVDLVTGVQLMPLPLSPGDVPARDELCDACAARCKAL